MNLFNELKKMHIMLIDNDEWIRDSLCIYFEGEGCHLLAVENAEKGMELLKEKFFEIIIAGYSLPGMDGLSFFKKIHKSYPNVLKILITAYRNNEFFSDAMGTEIDDIIFKPFTINMFEKTLSRLIE